MTKVINMQDLRYLNLFEKITRISTRFCFKYNEAIIFCVPKRLVSKGVGAGGENIKHLSRILRRKIKIIPIPQGIQHAKIFISAIVSPVTFKDLEITEDTIKGASEIILNAGSQNKAALIGRNKRRFLEMQQIVRDFFGKEFRIV